MDPNEVAEEEEEENDHVDGAIDENEDNREIRNQEKQKSIFQVNDETYKTTISYR